MRNQGRNLKIDLFIKDLTHNSLCGSDSSWGLRIFSLSHACDKTENIFLFFFTDLKTNHLS